MSVKKKIILFILVFCTVSLVIAVIALGKRELGEEIKAEDVIMTEQTRYEASAEEAAENAEAKEGLPDIKKTEKFGERVDFEQLKNINPEIFGWIRIPGTEIEHPLLCSETDDAYYLDHSSTKKESTSGAIYIEGSYNSAEMTDPVTVIYGHRMNSGAMFGRLAEIYKTDESFNAHRNIIIYMPEKELHYEIFCASSYDDRHIPLSFDFSDKEQLRSFVEEVISAGHGISDGDYVFSEDEKLVVLSTCVKGRSKQRFIVLARLVKTVGPDGE